MRITGGLGRGLPLRCPKGSATRPATDQMREAVFSSLGTMVAEARILDLFAGTGSYGLEALSRGASSCQFVDNDRKILFVLKQNAKNLTGAFRSQNFPEPEIQVLSGDVLSLLGTRISGRFDLIFLDPPYAQIESLWNPLLEKLKSYLHRGGRLVFELGRDPLSLPTGWAHVHTLGKKKRDSPRVIFLSLEEAP